MPVTALNRRLQATAIFRYRGFAECRGHSRRPGRWFVSGSPEARHPQLVRTAKNSVLRRIESLLEVFFDAFAQGNLSGPVVGFSPSFP